VVYVSSGVKRPGGETETQLFRIAQEALTNVARHADATLVRLELEQRGDTLLLTITDNGGGFASSVDTPNGRRTVAGLGLVGMRARARAANGRLTLTSSPGKGVTIRAEVPVGLKSREKADAA
jgi:signal transduction histidine kinase